jgi:hypothetical protein
MNSANEPLAEIGAELLFQVIAERAEKAGVIVTTNRPSSEWPHVRQRRLREAMRYGPDFIAIPEVDIARSPPHRLGGSSRRLGVDFIYIRLLGFRSLSAGQIRSTTKGCNSGSRLSVSNGLPPWMI